MTIFASPKISDDATITGNETSGTPASNLQKMQPTDIWRYNSTSAAIEIDLGSAQSIGLVALGYHNLSSSGTIRVRADSSQGGLTSFPDYDSGNLTAISFLDGYSPGQADGLIYDRNHFILNLTSTSVTEQWWRLDLSDASNEDGFLQAGRLYISPAFHPTRALRFSWGVSWMDGQNRTLGRGGQIYPRQRETRRQLTGDIAWDSAEDSWDQLFQLQRLRGTTQDIMVVTDESRTKRLQDWSVIGLFSEIEPIINPGPNLYETSIVIDELI